MRFFFCSSYTYCTSLKDYTEIIKNKKTKKDFKLFIKQVKKKYVRQNTFVTFIRLKNFKTKTELRV